MNKNKHSYKHTPEKKYLLTVASIDECNNSSIEHHFYNTMEDAVRIMHKLVNDIASDIRDGFDLNEWDIYLVEDGLKIEFGIDKASVDYCNSHTFMNIIEI